MRSFLHEGSGRYGPGMRPLLAGVLTCGALLVPVSGAAANHMVTANGTMCPHAAGEPVAGETIAPPGPVHAASSGPIAPAVPKAAPSGGNASPSKPASQAPSQRAQTQAQAQQGASSQSQSQRPASTQAQRPTVAVKPVPRVAAPAPAPARTDDVSGAPRPVPVARPAVTVQPRAQHAVKRQVAKQAPRPAVTPTAVAPLTIDWPAVEPVVVSADAPVTPVYALGLLGLVALGAIGIAAAFVRRRSVLAAKRAASSLSFVEEMDALIEAELQEMIAAATPRADLAPGELDVAGDERELSTTR